MGGPLGMVMAIVVALATNLSVNSRHLAISRLEECKILALVIAQKSNQHLTPLQIQTLARKIKISLMAILRVRCRLLRHQAMHPDCHRGQCRQSLLHLVLAGNQGSQELIRGSQLSTKIRHLSRRMDNLVSRISSVEIYIGSLLQYISHTRMSGCVQHVEYI